MLAYRVAYSGHTRYSPQEMVKPKGENGETPGWAQEVSGHKRAALL
jgi:hypothetical protein